jgi:hypothetical protein
MVSGEMKGIQEAESACRRPIFILLKYSALHLRNALVRLSQNIRATMT